MDLLNYNCIDFKKLLIIKAKSLKISDVECHILLIVMTMMDLHMKPINPQSISQFSSLTIKQIDTTLLSLLEMQTIQKSLVQKGKTLCHLRLRNIHVNT